MTAKTLFCMECGVGMPATAAFCRQCGAAVPEEDLAKSKQEAAEWAAAQLDKVIQMDASQKKGRRSSPGPLESGPADRQQLEAMGLPSNLKWAALGILVVAVLGSGGFALNRYVHKDDEGAHASATEDAHADHKADASHKADSDHKEAADHKADKADPHDKHEKAEKPAADAHSNAHDAHAPAAKASGH